MPVALRRVRRASFAQLGLVLLVGVLVSCGGAGTEARDHLIERLIAEEPSLRFDPRSAFGSAEDARWSFIDTDELAAWTTEGIQSFDVNERRAVLVPEGDPSQRPVMRLSRDVTLEAGSIHAFEMVRLGRWHSLSLWWAGPDESFSSARHVSARRDRTRKNTFVLPVAEHPLWRGTIARVRIDAMPRRDQPIRLVALSALRRSAGASSLAEVLTRPWKVDLGADVRNALIGAPGVPITRAVTIGERERLRLAYGMPVGTQVPVTFRVRLETASGPSSILLERTIKPQRLHELGRWSHHEASLDRWAGQAVTLHFETEATEVLDVGKGLPAWANPEIVGLAPASTSSDDSDPSRDDKMANVVFISLDTLRADRLSSYGYGKKTTPRIDAWANASAVRFASAVAQAPWTLPSHVSMLTGLDPQRHGVNHSSPMSASLDLLPEKLRRKGYATAAFTGGGYLHPHFGFSQGFDVFRYWPDRKSKEELRDGMARAVDWLESNGDRPFFLFFHTYETHFPHRRRMPFMAQLDGLDAFRLLDRRFEMRDRAFKQMKWGGNFMVVERPGDRVPHEGLEPDEWALLNDMYDSSVAYADAQVGRLLATLRQLGHGANTLVVITSDHGEALGEDGLVGHNYLAEHNLMVPLFIGFPDGRGQGRAVGEQVRSVDIVPTVLDYLGIAPSRRLDGVSLLPLIAGDASDHPEEAWSYASSANEGLSLRIKNRLKYRFNNSAWSNLNGSESLHDLRRDPGEDTDISEDHERLQDFRLRARRRLNSLHSGWRLEVRNHTRGLLRGRLHGEGLQHARIKMGIPACRCLFWRPGPVMRVPSKRAMSLQIEGHLTGELQISGALEMPDGRAFPFAHAIDLAGVRRMTTFGFDGSRWAPMTVFPKAQVRITLKRVGMRSTPPPPPASSGNRELEEQLRALGYVN